MDSKFLQLCSPLPFSFPQLEGKVRGNSLFLQLVSTAASEAAQKGLLTLTITFSQGENLTLPFIFI